MVNIFISAIYIFFLFLSLLILSLTIFLGIASSKYKCNTTYISRSEAYLEPKIFEKGTGFLDGTKEYYDIVYDLDTNMPADFYAPAVSNLVISGKKYIDSIHKYGKGGYLVCKNESEYSINSPYVTTLYSYPTTFTADGNYTVLVKPYDLEGYEGGELARYAVYLEYKDELSSGIRKKILLKDESNDYSTYTLDISETLRMHGITEVKDASVLFEIRPTTKEGKHSYVMFEQIIFSADESVLNYGDLASISLVDANASLSLNLDVYLQKPLGYWSGNSNLNIHCVELTMCNFTYDTYELPYGKKIIDLSYSDLEVLRKKGYCDYDFSQDKTLDINSFRVLDESMCCVIKIVDVKYFNVGSVKKPNIITCEVKGYLTYTHGTGTPVYTKPPKFMLGTDDKGFDKLGILLPKAFVSTIIILVWYNLFYLIAIAVRKILFIINGAKIIKNKNNI